MVSRKQADPPRNGPTRPPPNWTFLTNHSHVLVCIAQNADIRISRIADLVGIGERAAHRIVGDLVRAGYVVRSKHGRRNAYSVDFSQPLRHPLESEHTIGAIFRVLTGSSRRSRGPSETGAGQSGSGRSR